MVDPRRKHNADIMKNLLTTLDEPTVSEALNATPVEAKLWRNDIDKDL